MNFDPGNGAPRARQGHSVNHLHRMPFGACPVDAADPESGYDFRLWAPAQERVEVALIATGGGKCYVPCVETDGWHYCRVAAARAGDRYLYRLAGGLEVPDPASRFNPDDVHGASQLTAPTAFAWDANWPGRAWEEAVIYELHVGTFTPEGSYAAAEAHLPELAGIGITAIELMPLADFSGRRGWGYDGVLLFAPEASYGTPDALKHFIQSAHRNGLMVLLDVVYNHFGADGNYLHASAPQFFDGARRTPWGEAINFAGEASETVREFFINNALYWISEFCFDGLRLDAVHSIFDASPRHFLEELSQRVRACARREQRRVHLVLENDRNAADRLAAPGEAGRYDAQWNDDFHHAAHVILTGERDGYYRDFSDRPVAHLMRCLAEGYAFQGEHSAFHGGARGQSSAGLPATAFVNFLQNHDQVGNRAFGERLACLVPACKLRALVALHLLAPSPPLIFMGEEAGATSPFLYFCDFHGALARAVRASRQRQFKEFAAGRELPDPNAAESFSASRMDWAARERAEGRQWLNFYRGLLDLRRRLIVPRLPGLARGRAEFVAGSEHSFSVSWRAADGSLLLLQANLNATPSPPISRPRVPAFARVGAALRAPDRLGAWAVRGYLLPAAEGSP